MKLIMTAALSACLVVAVGHAAAQTDPGPKTGRLAAKGNQQDCKDRVTTQKGEKRNDAVANTDTDKACADVPVKREKKMHHMKNPTMVNSASAPQ